LEREAHKVHHTASNTLKDEFPFKPTPQKCKPNMFWVFRLSTTRNIFIDESQNRIVVLRYLLFQNSFCKTQLKSRTLRKNKSKLCVTRWTKPSSLGRKRHQLFVFARFAIDGWQERNEERAYASHCHFIQALRLCRTPQRVIFLFRPLAHKTFYQDEPDKKVE
jgi:hypothetical protein